MTKPVTFRYNDADLQLLGEASEAYFYPATSVDLVRALLRYPEKLVEYRANKRKDAAKPADEQRAAKDTERAAKDTRAKRIKQLKAQRAGIAADRDAVEQEIDLQSFNHSSRQREFPIEYAKWTELNDSIDPITAEIKRLEAEL